MFGKSFCWLALMLLARPAWAVSDEEKTNRARIHLKAGIAYYDDGRYEDASREMLSAYELSRLPDLQYNLAQCYERLNKLDEAARAYELYLAGKPAAADQKNVQARIDNLRERAKAEAAGQTLPAAPVEKVVFKTLVVYRAPPPPPGRVARWAAYGLFVLAAGGLATGIAYAVLAREAASEVTVSGNLSSPPTFDGKVRDTQESGQSYPIIAGVSFGVAALSAAAGIALFVVSKKIDKEQDKRDKDAGLSFAFGPQGGGVTYKVSF
jgi:tetratricopeptide (TPR) repeat protein